MEDTQIITWVMYVYIAATVLNLGFLAFRNQKIGQAAAFVLFAGIVGHTASMGLRWYNSYQIGIGHAPLSNLYESLVFFAWTIVLLYLILDWRFKVRALGVIVAPMAYLTLAFASLQSDEIQPLMPALQSNWLHAHVITCFLGYAAFAVAFITSILYLVKAKGAGKGAKDEGGLFPGAGVLDEVTYKMIAVGFPMLTIGIVTGAAWAQYAWGSYWSWDPKETWSLIVWFIYAAYLHSRIARGWRGKRAAILSVIGFAATLFCYLGVNLLLSGLHSYASG